MRKIPMKNYIILLFVAVATGLIVTYLVNLYKSKQDYDNDTNHRMSFLREIYADDFNNYITENIEGIIYISNSSDDALQNIEKQLKKDIQKREYTQDIVYINSKNLAVNFGDTLNKYYSDTVKLTEHSSIPNVLIVKDGLIQRTLYITSETTEDQIIDFMELYYND